MIVDGPHQVGMLPKDNLRRSKGISPLRQLKRVMVVGRTFSECSCGCQNLPSQQQLIKPLEQEQDYQKQRSKMRPAHYAPDQSPKQLLIVRPTTNRLRWTYLLGIAVILQLFQISSIFLSRMGATPSCCWEPWKIDGHGAPRSAGDGVQGRISEKVVVVYTGPTSLNATEGKNWLYLKNFEYFLTHGVDCLHQDTVFALTEVVAAHYENRISEIKQRCDSERRAESSMAFRKFKTPSVQVIHRKDRCYDMEGFRMAMEHVDLFNYDFTVYLNCGVVGPKLPDIGGENRVSNQIPWTQRYTSLLSDTVKMSGLSINAYDFFPHIQSMVFALDREALKIIREAGAVFDCGDSTMSEDLLNRIIRRYEIGMSRAILKAGYNIRSTHGLYGPVEIRPQDAINRQILDWCKDMWYPEQFPVSANSKWEDFMFFKSSRRFLLPRMEEEIQYNHDHELETLKLPVAGVTVLEVAEDASTDPMESLWNGGASDNINVDLSSLRVSVVVSHCKFELSWLQDYLTDFPLRDLTVVSKCGIDPDPAHLPPGARLMKLPNIGRVDHTMAYWMAEVIPEQDITRDDVIIFLKDNLEKQPPESRRNMAELLRGTAVNGFSCLQTPVPGYSHFHVSEVLTRYSMTHYIGDLKYQEDGSIVLSPNNPNDEFKSSFKNMKEWLEHIGIAALSPVGLVPVCYGGSYAVQASRILDVPAKIRSKLVKSLSRGNNIEEGHFAERTWAALFSPTLTKDQAKYILDRAKYVKMNTGVDGGGILGSLVEVDVPGHFRPLLGGDHDVEKVKWNPTQGRWQWTEIYRARVVDSANVCKRPRVEPDIPKATPTVKRPLTIAMCTATARNDLRYLNEWIDFHVVQGFAHFYMYDTNDLPQVEHFLNSTRPGWSEYVSVTHWPGKNQQADIWSDCFTVKARQGNHAWAANFDVDEFLLLWRHEHIMSMVQERCTSGSVHVALYTFSPDYLIDEQREELSSMRLLNDIETYEMSAKLSSRGLPRPLLHRNVRRGPVGWEGNDVSRLQFRVKTIARTDDVDYFQNALPKLLHGERRTLGGVALNTLWVTPEASGNDIASLFHYKFKSVPEVIYETCNGGRISSEVELEACETVRAFATTPGAWISYRYKEDYSAWDFLRDRIPWYGHFELRNAGVSCPNLEADVFFGERRAKMMVERRTKMMSGERRAKMIWQRIKTPALSKPDRVDINAPIESYDTPY